MNLEVKHVPDAEKPKPRSRGDEPAIKGSLPEMGLKTPLTRG